MKKSKKNVKFRDLVGAYLRLLGYGYKSNKIIFPLVFILIFIVSIVPFFNTFVDSKIVDQIVSLLNISAESRNLDQLFIFIGIAIALSFSEKILWACITYFEKVTYFASARLFAKQFTDKCANLDLYHFENNETNLMIEKAKSAYDWKTRDSLNRMIWLTADLVRIVSSVLIVLNFSIIAFLIVLIATLPSLIANTKMGRDTWGIWDADTKTRKLYWWTRDYLTREDYLKELRILGATDFLANFVENVYDKFMNKAKKDQLKRTLIDSILGNISTLGILGFWIFSIFATLNGQITVGLLTFYVSSMYRFSDALSGFFRRIGQQYEDGLYIIDYIKFLDLKPTLKPGHLKLIQKASPPQIEFKNVSFFYPDTQRLVLDNLSFTISPGEKVALVGVNGSGKSTIIKLLCRFYDVTSGEILIDGINIKDLDLQTYYKLIGALFQDFNRYGQFSVSENVSIGDVSKGSSEKEIMAAINKADADKFIRDYKDGIKQLLDKSFEGGIDPSVGQWQKIALARIFFRDPKVLILDEPTSAIDAKAEAEIFDRLYEFTREKTVIIISHRFSTVRKADRIMVIDDGKLQEQGSHNQLLKNNGKYAEAFLIQAKGYK